MALNIVAHPYQYFGDPDAGRPIAGGDVYVGIVDLDPTILANQKSVTLRQEDGTEVSVSQPISLSAGGYPTFNGSPVAILVDGDYSLAVLDSLGVQKFYSSASPGAFLLTKDNTVAVVDTVSDLTASSFESGITVDTRGYTTAGDGGAARYLIQSAADFGGTPDEFGDHTLANGNIAVLQIDGVINGLQYGLDKTGATNDSTRAQALFDRGRYVHLPEGTYQFANINPATPSGEIVVFGDGSVKTVISVPAGYSGYVFNTTGRYDIRGMAFLGESADGISGQYGIGADGAGQSSGRPILKDLRMFNFDQCIRFGFEYEHPLGLYYELVYCQNFKTAGINLGGTTGAASSGESAWQFDDVIVTNPSNTPTEYAVTVTPDTPSATEDSLDWTAAGDSPEFGYIVLRSADGSTNWEVPPNWSAGNLTATTFVAEKSVAETWNYKVLRMTVGVNCRRAKCVNFGALQTEYTGIGLRLEDIQGASLGSHYFEIRNTSEARGGFASIYTASVNSFFIGGMWAEEAGYGVFVSGNSKLTLASMRASALSWAAIGNTGSTDQTIGYENIAGATTIYRSPAGNAQDFNYMGREYDSSEHIVKLSHTTKSGYKVQYRGTDKGGLFADTNGAWVELNALDLTLNSKTLRPVVTNGIGSTALTDGVATNVLTLDTASTNADGSVRLHYKVEVFSGGVARQTESGFLDINTLNVATATPTVGVQSSNTLQTINAGTLTVTFGSSAGSGTATITCNANTSLGSPSINIELTPLSVMGNISNLVQQ